MVTLLDPTHAKLDNGELAATLLRVLPAYSIILGDLVEVYGPIFAGLRDKTIPFSPAPAPPSYPSRSFFLLNVLHWSRLET